MASFSFGFGGDDIEDDGQQHHVAADQAKLEAQPAAATSAFPVAGKPQLPTVSHKLEDMLPKLPSKIAFGVLDMPMKDGTVLQVPRRELWDIKVQVMAEDEGLNADSEGLGDHDVKTGIYEGGFKSWESSVDLVKVLRQEGHLAKVGKSSLRIIELGCGTALPSLAVFSQAAQGPSEVSAAPLSIAVADYNPSVLQLATMPNFVLAWALAQRHACAALKDAFDIEGELELGPEVVQAFQDFLRQRGISLNFLSGGWSPEFITLLYDETSDLAAPQNTLVLGAETIYSPFALESFNETIFRIMSHEKTRGDGVCETIVAAKKLYFGVGGSLDDFIDKAKAKGAEIRQLMEETQGVWRGVVSCTL